jgi:hypothetical protein
MVVIVRFNVGGAWMGIEGCDWFSKWVNGGRGSRVTMCGFGGLCCWYGCRHLVLEHAGICCKLVVCIVEWVQSRGALVWLDQSKGFVVLLLGVANAWVQFVMRVQFRVW